MKKANSIFWGLALVAVGVFLSLNAFGITDINIFFDGWWTLFIIVPCTIGLFTDYDKTGNLIGLLIGLVLLLCCQGLWDFDMIRKLLIPAVIVIIGLKLIFGNLFGNKGSQMLHRLESGDGSSRAPLPPSPAPRWTTPVRCLRAPGWMPCSAASSATSGAPSSTATASSMPPLSSAALTSMFPTGSM